MKIDLKFNQTFLQRIRKFCSTETFNQCITIYGHAPDRDDLDIQRQPALTVFGSI